MKLFIVEVNVIFKYLIGVALGDLRREEEAI